MCPLYPFHLVLTYAVLIMVTIVAAEPVAKKFLKTLHPRLKLNESLVSYLELKEGQSQQYTFYIDDLPDDLVGELILQVNERDKLEHFVISPSSFTVNYNSTSEEVPAGFLESHTSGDSDFAQSNGTHQDNAISGSRGRYFSDYFIAEGKFIGFSSFKFVISNGNNDTELMESSNVPVTVKRGKHTADIIFVHVVVVFMIILYVNMGCAIDLQVIKATLRRPVAPLIGLLSQYLFMPLCSYGLGYALLGSNPALWLGMYVTGCSPGGGGSNMWTLLLGGSLDLSVTMTFISTLAAFGAMPLWMWALAPSIYADGQFGTPPYRNIAVLALGMAVPMSIGLAIKRYCPRGADWLVKLLKPLCLLFVVVVLTLGVYTYWPLFQYLDGRVAACSLLLPLLGFIAGALASVICKRTSKDTIAISVETGLQNTGLAIGLLKIALLEFAPLGDIAMIVPIAVATCTPILLSIPLICIKVRDYLMARRKNSEPLSHSVSKHSEMVQISSSESLHNGIA